MEASSRSRPARQRYADFAASSAESCSKNTQILFVTNNSYRFCPEDTTPLLSVADTINS